MTTARIAVVEDHEGLRTALERLLQASGYKVSAFGSAEELLASEERGRVECLVLDVRLPGLSGFELRERLAAEGTDTPAIFVTAYDEPAMRQRAASNQAAFFLKPVPGAELLAAVTHALGEA